MKKLSIVVFLVGCIAGVPGRAALQKGENQATGKSGAKLSTITGCVAQSGAVYLLNQAIIGTDPDVDTQTRPSPEGTPKNLSYALIGGASQGTSWSQSGGDRHVNQRQDIERYHRNQRNSGDEGSRYSDCEVGEDGRRGLPINSACGQ